MFIIIIGYMGSGKTSAGRLLSLYLGRKFYDLDEILLNWKNQYIHNILFKNGENYFRTIETYVLHFLKSIKKKKLFFLLEGEVLVLEKKFIV